MCLFYYIDGSVAMVNIAAFFVLEIFLEKGKIMKKIWTKALAYVLAATMCLSAVNVPVYAQGSMVTEVSTEAETMSEAVTEEATVSGNDAEPTTEEVVSTEEATTDGNDGSTWNQVTTENVFEGENYKVTFTLTSNWDAGYNANVKLENTGDSTIQNWYLGFDYNNSITNIWNAEVSSNEGNEYVVKNVGWNQDIAAGNSIEFGLSGDHAFKGFPENYELLGTSMEVAEDDYTIQYIVDGDWGTGFYGSISVTNNTDTDLEDWVLEFDFDREITEIWNGVIEEHEGNHYVVRNAEYNCIITPGENVSIGIKGCEGKSGDEPINFSLYSSKLLTNCVEEEVDETLDSDNDGIPNYLEDYFGTNKDKEDTDDDGLSDYIELYIIGSDATVVDSDGNGIDDGNEDADQDGLSNLEEIEIGTSLIKVDTDGDDLSDYEELKIYQTSPLEYDTDQDGVSDGKEIEIGTNPIVADESFFISVSTNNEDTVQVSVEIKLEGKQVDSLSIERYNNEFFFPVNMPGYIGGAYDFFVDGTFDKATIKFEFNEELLEDADFDPVIYYFNEEKQLLEELDTTVVGNVASTEVTHFSKYILINRKVYQNSFEWQDVWNTTGFSGVEVILVIDDSGSMVSNDRYNQRLTVAQNLIDNLPQNSKVGVVKFTSYTTKLTSSLTSDKETAKSYLTTSYFRSSGGTSMYTAINSSFSMFEASDDNILKMMIVLSDGATSYTNLHSSVVTTANNNGVKIYTVGLGSFSSSYFTQYLKPLANNTGGAFYLASDASQLEDIYKDINKKIDIETDSDNDGIADYYEENMVMFNGVTIKLDKNNPDSDGDGLLDGEEVAELNYQYNADKTQVIVTGKLISDPLEPDSDYDGKPDSSDKAPLNNHFNGILSTQYATSAVSFNMDYRWFFNDNTIYCEDLSIASSLFASAIYQPNSLSINDSERKDSTEGTSISEVMDYFGMNNTKTIQLDDIYDDTHVSEMGLGYRTVSYNGEDKNIIIVVVRGTNGTIEEWSSNFEIGKLNNFGTISDWVNSNNHMGFDIAANRIINLVNQYVNDNNLDANDSVYWITGHSRGAAIANIIGAYFENDNKTAYTYTYAAPNTTMDTKAGEYTTIFNVVNSDDFVPCLPMASWGYTRYGKTASVSLASNYEKEWEKLTGIWDYNPDTYGMQDTVKALGNIITSGDAREEVYEYTCNCHGDNSNDTITITNYGISKKSREAAIAKIPSNALPYCEITRYDGGLIGGWNFDNCQTPAYFMQILAAKMAGELTNKQFVVDINVADRYENAKLAIVKSAIGGLAHPHYTESYYILSNHITNGMFK